MSYEEIAHLIYWSMERGDGSCLSKIK